MRLTRKRLAWAGVVVACAIGLGSAWWALRTPPRVDMAEYAPENLLAFVAIDSVPAIANGLTESSAWNALAKPLGLSSQLEYAAPLAEVLGKAGLGPDDAVALGRAQLALVVTGLEAGTEPAPEGAEESGSVVIRPHFALIIKTHVSPGAARSGAAARLPLFARKAYGEQAVFSDEESNGTVLSVARHPSEPRQIVWAVHEDIVIVGNQTEAVRSVLDVLLGRGPSLARGFHLERLRAEVRARESVVFAYFSKEGAGKLVGLGPGLIAAGLTSDSGRASSVARLVATISERTIEGIAYSGAFDGGRFVDRYFALLTPRMADSLTANVRPIRGESQVLGLAPETLAGLTVVRIEQPGETFNRLMTSLSSAVDVNVAATVTQVAIEIRRSHGVTPEAPVAPLLGDEIAFLDFGGGEPVAAAFEVRDEVNLIPVVERYLRTDGSAVSIETYKGFDILKSTHEDGRAAAFVGRFAVLATRDQIVRLVDAREAGGVWARQLKDALGERGPVVLASQEPDRDDPARLMLSLSGVLRATDGSPELLGREDIRQAIETLKPSISLTTVHEGGITIETRSSVGNLIYLTSFLR